MASSLGSSAWPSAWQRGKYEKVRPNRGIPRYRRDSRSLSGGKTSPGNYPTRYASIHHICESGIKRIHGTTAVRGEFTKGVHAERYLRRGIPRWGSGRPMPGYQRKSVRSKPILGLRPRGDLQRSGAARQRPRPGRDQSDKPRGHRADECRLLPTRPWRWRPNRWVRRDSSCRPHQPRAQPMSRCVGCRRRTAAQQYLSDGRRTNLGERLRRDLACTRDASRNNERRRRPSDVPGLDGMPELPREHGPSGPPRFHADLGVEWCGCWPRHRFLRCQELGLRSARASHIGSRLARSIA